MIVTNEDKLQNILDEYGVLERRFAVQFQERHDTTKTQSELNRVENDLKELFRYQDTLTRLFESTKALHERFGDDWTLKDAINKFNEESDEFKLELNHLGDGYTVYGDVFAEMIDVLVTMFSCCIRVGINPHGLSDTIETVIQKNDAKTLDTHQRLNGMIVRK